MTTHDLHTKFNFEEIFDTQLFGVFQSFAGFQSYVFLIFMVTKKPKNGTLNKINLSEIKRMVFCYQNCPDLHCCMKCPQILREKTSSQNSQGIALRIQWHFFHQN